jgi:hypothetical protein
VEVEVDEGGGAGGGGTVAGGGNVGSGACADAEDAVEAEGLYWWGQM